ncbi:MAG: formamidopyrimidine-DNA glycosylase [Thiomicrorhabdus sp.]|nr:MAG: formamidopyrimidine-DNA glycosylase [Thiomicrorhabdus sp.]
MPELPEVETTCRGIEPHIVDKMIIHFVIRNGKLRWPVAIKLCEILPGLCINKVSRRGKYILLETTQGTLMIHLGMSGNLRVLPANTPLLKHDHIEIQFDSGIVLRFNDPRRFGSILWHDISQGDINNHKLLFKLAPEPLSTEFNEDFFYRAIHNRRVAIKNLMMNSQVAVGAGNIYANEALFVSRINPKKPGNCITKQECADIVQNIKAVLKESIEQGGTTLKDFVKPDGKPGYFEQHLNVYGRENQPCPKCSTPIEKIIIAQRSTFYCPCCQPGKEQ